MHYEFLSFNDAPIIIATFYCGASSLLQDGIQLSLQLFTVVSPLSSKTELAEYEL
jgi:hypothetical protein